MNKRILIISLVGIIIAGSVITVLTMNKQKSTTAVTKAEVKLSPADLAEESKLVLVGTFISSKVREVTEEGTGEKLIYTDWQVEPKEIWKGQKPDSLTVSILGGDNGKLSVIADTLGGQDLKPGDERLLFLYYREDLQAYAPLSANQAIFTALSNGNYRDEAGAMYSKDELTREIAVGANQ